MAQIVTNIIQNSLSGMVAGAVTTVGGYAGDAVSGVGNLIEAKGQAVGNNIAKKFEGWGTGVTSYGNSVRSATAPNAGYSGYPTSTKKKPVTAAKKAPASSGAKKSLPTIPERKLLTAPPTKSVQEKGPSQGTYNTDVAPYKQGVGANRSIYAASTAAASTITTKTNRTNKSARPQAGKIGNAKLNQAQKALSPIKSNTNAAGKVVPEKRSLPGNSGRPASAVAGKTSNNERYKGPLQLGGSGENKAKIEGSSTGGYQGSQKGGYQGPLNLGGIMDGGGPKPKPNGQKDEKKPTPSKPASVVGGAPKAKPGGYAGPLNLGGLA